MQSAEFELFIRRVRIRQVSIPFASLREPQLAGMFPELFINLKQKTNINFISNLKEKRTPLFSQKNELDFKRKRAFGF
ncbi:hypothetical protein [Methanimicrococcus hongohii]|uniref:hypothetical protein n=1 Tax=Methanimicrococcus hongohii TaxID=3028295 RepID=UPI002931062F|nr:hypothetical protein [Methanimicrococcus sp. Hf6]